MLIFAPSKEQCNHISIGHTIRDRIDAAYCGDVAFLFHLAMQVCRLKQNSRPTYTGDYRSAQQAVDNNKYCTAVSRACALQSIATIGPTNLTMSKSCILPLSHHWVIPTLLLFQTTKPTPFQVTFATPFDMLLATRAWASTPTPLTSSPPSSIAPSRTSLITSNSFLT
jgi:hypothetical protein